MPDFKKILKMSPAPETELIYTENELFYTRYSQSAISENIREQDSILNIRVLKNNKLGSAQTNKYDDASIKLAYQKAMESVKAQKKDNSILPLPDPKKYKETDHFDKETAELAPLKKAEILAGILNKAKNEKVSGLFTNGYSGITIANSNGLMAQHKASECKVSFTVEIDGATSSWSNEARNISGLNPISVYETAREFAKMNANPQNIEPGKYDVVLTPHAFLEILDMLLFYGLATLPYIEKRSPMNDRLGKKIFSELFSVYEDPFDAEAGGMSFDYEGWPRQKVTLIENGVLKGFVHDRKTAAAMGMKSTGHSLGEPNTFGPLPLNPIVPGGNHTPDEMIGSLKKGLYIRKLHYTNVLNRKDLLITGMTRDGVFYVENGKIKHPVINLRFGVSLFEILSNITMLGPQSIIDFSEGWGKLPWVKIEGFNFSSSTEF